MKKVRFEFPIRLRYNSSSGGLRSYDYIGRDGFCTREVFKYCPDDLKQVLLEDQFDQIKSVHLRYTYVNSNNVSGMFGYLIFVVDDDFSESEEILLKRWVVYQLFSRKVGQFKVLRQYYLEEKEVYDYETGKTAQVCVGREGDVNAEFWWRKVPHETPWYIKSVPDYEVQSEVSIRM